MINTIYKNIFKIKFKIQGDFELWKVENVNKIFIN